MTDLYGFKAALNSAAQRLLDGLLADLSSLGPNQHTRLLRLHTPLGLDVLLAEKADITESLGPHPEGDTSLFNIQLLALSTRADLSPLDVLGKPVLLELLTSKNRTQLRPFHGHVTAFELLGSDGGYARYQLTIEPWLAFLRHRSDAYVFQDMSVLDISEAVFADYAGQGALQPAWRWDVADRQAFAKRSLCIQFNETDLTFLQRLWAEEGLFCWLEHSGDANDSTTLGSHTLVLADHSGAFKPNEQDQIRFTQSATVIKEDSITQWHEHRRVGPTTLNTASWDYRSVTNHSASLNFDEAHAQPMPLVHTDQPGAYAYETPAQAERRAAIQWQALQAQRKQFFGRGTVRTLSPATTFKLTDHDQPGGLLSERTGEQTSADESRFVLLSVRHRARNNINADAQAGLMHLLGPGVLGHGGSHVGATHHDEPLYEARLTAQRASVPVRMAIRHDNGALVHAKPTVHGAQTALVVGIEGSPIHTDRDGRIKVQFHWQRGSQSSHRLSHPSGDGDNAPGNDGAGTWVRVAQSWAGANWGGVFIPRVGQEVIVAFVEGDIDRPVVMGAAYNGQGAVNAQGNQVNEGKAPAWFAGDQMAGQHEGHAHAASLSGIKTQSLDTSGHGDGGGSGPYNQLVMDHTPAQGRVLAHTTQHQTWLQMGHLLQQHDNQRLAPRGQGLELHTLAQGAVRAGSGLHISAFARTGGSSAAQGKPLDTRESQGQLQAHAELVAALAGNAQTHLAKLPSEAAPDKLPAMQALHATLSSLQAQQQGHDSAIPVSGRPDLIVSAPGAISTSTPAHTVISVGQAASISAANDANMLSQRHTAWAVKDGISLFTRGEAKDKQRAVQDTGLKLHAASGNVNVQAQSGPLSVTAEKAIDIQSTAANITISAPSSLMLNGGGGYIKINGGDIEIGTSGVAGFKASMKELAGGGSANGSKIGLPVPGELHLAPQGSLSLRFAAEGSDALGAQAGWAGQPYTVYSSHGEVLAQGAVGQDGRTGRVTVKTFERVVMEIGDPGRTEFIPLGRDQTGTQVHVPEGADTESHTDETDWDDPSKVSPASTLFDHGGASARQQTAFLGPKTVQELLQQLGIDPTAAN